MLKSGWQDLTLYVWGKLGYNEIMTRNLETLIQQFNNAKEMDRHFEFEGQIYWLEVDGMRTRMVDAWLNDLSPVEKAMLEAYMARTLGYGSCSELFKDGYS